MSDLISRSALIEKLRDLADANYEKIQCYMAIIGAIGKVQDAPIAYDINKVVEELEEKSDDIPVQYEENYEKGFDDGICYAIDIVKRGGVE